MRIGQTGKPTQFVIAVFSVCFVLRIGEYFLLRTDQSVIGEAFIHKLAGMVILLFACRYRGYSVTDIGFSSQGALRNTLFGLLLGIFAFSAAYAVEYFILASAGEGPQLQLFATSYAIQGNRVMETSILYVIICITGNLINVVMEEGIFRGLFVRVFESKRGFFSACLLSSILFGFWHITQPVRNFLDGEQLLSGAVMAGTLLIFTSTLMGIQMCLLLKITGSLWVSLTAHFLNNTTINLLHISTVNAVDSMQAVRITIAQTLIFFAVLAVFLYKKSSKKATFRAG